MAETSHFSGYILRGFNAENLGFKPNIGDFGAYFSPIRINSLFAPQYLKGVPSNGAKITPCRGSNYYRTQRHQDVNALYAPKSRECGGEAGLNRLLFSLFLTPLLSIAIFSR